MTDIVYIPQSGVIPYRWQDGQLEILLITSRRTGKWLIPKGHLEPPMSPAESAAQEAYEEAGVEGIASQTTIGTYHYTKRYRYYAVQVYPLEVTDIHEEWPELGQRKRQWFTPTEASQATDNLELSLLLASFDVAPPTQRKEEKELIEDEPQVSGELSESPQSSDSQSLE
jgi:8-oxo-dGTP pyrophosphatase MutT (NUDIX family)